METQAPNAQSPTTNKQQDSFLRKQAWDYFSTHASQRMSIFNFYIALSSVTATTYAASWKADSNLQSARWLLSFLLCLFAFVFWKLDQRNKALIKNAERALKYFESTDKEEITAKVFSQEEIETDLKRRSLVGWRRLQIWKWTLTYSHCLSFVYIVFGTVGAVGFIQAVHSHIHLPGWIWRIWTLL
jgi:cbb3-type cytochrome oxidase subunit 3